MNKITSPFGVLTQLKPEKFQFHPAAWMGTLIASFGLLLLQSQFLLAPGIPIHLPQVAPEHLVSINYTDVLTVGPYDTFFLNGQVMPLEKLEIAFQQHIQNKKTPPPYTLLIKTDEQTPIKTFLNIAAIAESSGFHQLQIATQPLTTPSTFKDL